MLILILILIFAHIPIREDEDEHEDDWKQIMRHTVRILFPTMNELVYVESN